MRRFYPAITALALLLVLASCAHLPLPDQPARFPVMSSQTVSESAFVAYLGSRNPDYPLADSRAVYQAYAAACRAEGVNLVLALAQMIHETGFLRFGGTVQAAQNNFAGLGTVNAQTPGEVFPDIATGALAHVQHLKAYGSTLPLATPLVDRRFRYVRRGSAPTLAGLAGTWAADPDYAAKVWRHVQGLMQSR